VLLSACGSPAPQSDGAAPDNGRDAVVVDDAGTTDAVELPEGATGRRCRSDGECNNGLFCDGVEQCGPDGYCVESRNPGCDDQIGCTDDRCDEAQDRCDFVPVSARCGAGQQCVPGDGCVSPDGGG
jgi:hypothetical protein